MSCQRKLKQKELFVIISERDDEEEEVEEVNGRELKREFVGKISTRFPENDYNARSRNANNKMLNYFTRLLSFTLVFSVK